MGAAREVAQRRDAVSPSRLDAIAAREIMARISKGREHPVDLPSKPGRGRAAHRLDRRLRPPKNGVRGAKAHRDRALQVVEEDDAGVYLSGVKMLGTSAVFSDEAWIGNILPLAPEQKALAVQNAELKTQLVEVKAHNKNLFKSVDEIKAILKELRHDIKGISRG